MHKEANCVSTSNDPNPGRAHFESFDTPADFLIATLQADMRYAHFDGADTYAARNLIRYHYGYPKRERPCAASGVQGSSAVMPCRFHETATAA